MKSIEFPPQAVYIAMGAMLRLISKGPVPETPSGMPDNDGNYWHVAVDHKGKTVILSRREKAFSNEAVASSWRVPTCSPSMIAEFLGKTEPTPAAIASEEPLGPVELKVNA